LEKVFWHRKGDGGGGGCKTTKRDVGGKEMAA